MNKKSFHDKVCDFGYEYPNILTVIIFSIMVGSIGLLVLISNWLNW